MTIFKKIKQTAAMIALAATLWFSGCAHKDLVELPPIPTQTIQLADASIPERPKEDEEAKEKEKSCFVKPILFYGKDEKSTHVRTEYGSDLPFGISAWGFVETDGKSYFALTTASKEIAKPLYAGIEHRSSDGFEDFTRAGLFYKGKTFGERGPLLKFKAMQKVGPDSDLTLGALLVQELSRELEFSALYDRTGEDGYYAEAGLTYRPDWAGGLEFQLQGRSGGSIHDHTEVQGYIGIAYKPQKKTPKTGK